MKLTNMSNRLPVPQQQTPEQQLREVAELYEKNFMREMYKAMRGTVPENTLVKTNQAEKIFQEQLDDKYIDQWSARGGVGLADIIYKDLVAKYGDRMGIRSKLPKAMGPIAFRPQDQGGAPSSENQSGGSSPAGVQNPRPIQIQDRTQPNQKSIDLRIVALNETLKNEVVKNPWAGKLMSAQELNGNLKVLQIAHDNGLQSSLSFRGQLHPQTLQSAKERIESGADLATLSPDARELWWNISDPKETEGSSF